MKTLVEAPIIKRRHVIKELRKKHEPLFVKECLNAPAVFIVKTPGKHEQSGENIITLYPSELMRKEGVYIELVTADCKRTNGVLYKWLHHEHLDEYEKIKNDVNHILYVIPVNELLIVSQLHSKPKEIKDIQLKLNIKDKPESKQEPMPNPEQCHNDVDTSSLEDCSLSEMTLRDKIALDWMKPVSKKEWINKLILEHQK